jgi:hypothetical protein
MKLLDFGVTECLLMLLLFKWFVFCICFADCKLVDSLLKHGKTSSWQVVVMELIPGSYILIDGNHRMAAWWALYNVNPNLPKSLPAKVLSSNMTWTQIEMVASGQNNLPAKTATFLDVV